MTPEQSTTVPRPAVAHEPGRTPDEQERAAPHAGPPVAPQIAVHGFSLYYGRTPALKRVTLDVLPRSVTAIIGPSGCGKSTLLRSFNRMNDLIPNVRVE